MAVTLTLSPWPSAGTAGATAALAYVKDQCGGRVAASDDAACQLGMVAAALVEREAPGAPVPIKTEACIRMIGYLSQSDFGAVRSETIGPLSQDYVVMHGPAFRRCGAKGLLSPWRVRRAGSIG